MNLFRQKRVVVVVGAAAALAIYCWLSPISRWWQDGVGESITKNGEANGLSSDRPTPRNRGAHRGSLGKKPKTPIAQRMKQARGDVEMLITLFSEAEEGGLLEDAQWRRYYYEVLHKFSPEQIGQLYASIAKPSTSAEFNSVCGMNWADNVKDPNKRQRVYGILNAIPSVKSRTDLIYRVFKKSDLLSPTHLAHTLENIERVDYAAIGEVIEWQMKKMNDTEHREAVEAYFIITDNPAIVRPMAEQVVERLALKDIEAAKKWLLEAPPHLVSSGDKRLMAVLARENMAEGVSFIDELMVRKENKRASSAISALGSHYARKHPEEALNWAIALPDFVTSQSRQQVIHTALYALSRKDIQRVRDLAAVNKDPELKWLYNIAIKRHNDK